MLAKNNIDADVGQESWQKEGSTVNVKGYKWFGKPHTCQNRQREEGGVGFLVRDCLVNEVGFISSVKYADSVWIKVRGRRERTALFVGCVYIPTDSTSIAIVDSCYDRFKEDVLGFREKGTVELLGDFNARVSRSVDVDNVVGMFG